MNFLSNEHLSIYRETDRQTVDIDRDSSRVQEQASIPLINKRIFYQLYENIVESVVTKTILQLNDLLEGHRT